MNRLHSFIGILIAVVFALAACQPLPAIPKITATPTIDPTSTPEPTHLPTSTKPPEITLDEASLKGIQIVLLHPWSAETGRVMDQLVDEFNQINSWGIHVILREPGSTGMAIQELKVSSDEEFEIDIAALPLSELLTQDSKGNAVLDLNSYVYSRKYGLTDAQIEDYWPAFWNENLLGGKLWGLPAQQSANLLFYNVTWAEELGFSENPVTAADFKNQSCAANTSFRSDFDRQNDGLGGWIVNSNAGTLYSWMENYHAFNPQTPPEKFNTNATHKTFGFLNTLQSSSCAWTSRLSSPYDYFATRQALFYSGSTQDIPQQTAIFQRVENTDAWKVIPYPGTNTHMLTNGLTFGIFYSTPERQLAAWLFLRWMADANIQARILQSSGSLPLGKAVLDHMQDYQAQYPQWKTALDLIPRAQPLPALVEGVTVNTILEDAGTFLFRGGVTPDDISGLLEQLDETIAELVEQQS